MDFTRFELGSEDRHDMLVLLDAGHAFKSIAFDRNLPMILSARQIEDFDLGSRISFLKASFHLFWCHGSQGVTKD